jgi:hypothetical protein
MNPDIGDFLDMVVKLLDEDYCDPMLSENPVRSIITFKLEQFYFMRETKTLYTSWANLGVPSNTEKFFIKGQKETKMFLFDHLGSGVIHVYNFVSEDGAFRALIQET